MTIQTNRKQNELLLSAVDANKTMLYLLISVSENVQTSRIHTYIQIYETQTFLVVVLVYK